MNKFNGKFTYEPASFLPSRDVEMLNRVRNIKREDMEYTNENGFSVKIVHDPALMFAQDLFHRIYLSDVMDKHLTMVCPNNWVHVYGAVAEMINKFNVSCRNVDAFAMDEYADQDGNVAPISYGGSLGYNFRKRFWAKIREDLRPSVEHWHIFTNENKGENVYSSLIEEVGDGGADVFYTATGWPGHTAFIDPGAVEFKADTLEEYCKLGSRITTQTPLSIAENSMFWVMGGSGDAWTVPPRAATIGPRDAVNARERVEMHNFANPDGNSWQRMISRIELYGPISMECPASILRLGKGTCYVSEVLAAPIKPWQHETVEKELLEK